MLFVIMGAFVIAISLFVGFENNKTKKIIFGLLGALLCIIGVFCPVSGYEKIVVLAEHVLEKIDPSENKYIIQTNDGVVKYVIKEKSDDQKEKMMLYTNSNAEVIVVEKAIRPIIKKYSIKPKKTIFTFAMLPEKIKYRIFLNKNDIKNE